jgi:hypothetical protein
MSAGTSLTAIRHGTSPPYFSCAGKLAAAT